MTPDEFRSELARLGFTQIGFARFLIIHGHDGKEITVERNIRRWVQNGPPGEAVVILKLYEKIKNNNISTTEGAK